MALPPPFSEVNWQPDDAAIRAEARHWLRGFPVGATVLFCVLWWWKGSPHFIGPAILLATGLTVGTLGRVRPQTVRWFYRLWFFLICAFEYVIATTTLVLFYYLILTPFGLGSQLFRRKAFRKRRDAELSSYWEHPGEPLTPKDYFKQY